MKSENTATLIIIDESERLRPSALEYLRDRYDRTNTELILIGMPGIEKQFSRYPRLYSRVGFAHEYRALVEDELRFILACRWCKRGLTFNPDDFTEAVATIARSTRGNFRVVNRLFTHMGRIMKINELHTIADDVVETARSTLVISI